MKNKLLKNINFSFEFFLNKNSIKNIIYFNKKILLKPKFLTITYNNNITNKKIINYFIFKKIKILPHIICKNIRNFNYFLNLYYINNLKGFLLIKGDQKILNVYSNNLLNAIKKNYKNIFKIFLGSYTESHPNNLFSIWDHKNNFIKSNINYKNIFITQYFYNLESFFYFLDDFKKIKNKIKIIPGILPINCLKKVIFFSNICKSELPLWILKKLNNNFFKRNSFKKICKEIVINFLFKLIKFKLKNLHFYTMNNVILTNTICENLNNIYNL